MFYRVFYNPSGGVVSDIRNPVLKTMLNTLIRYIFWATYRHHCCTVLAEGVTCDLFAIREALEAFLELCSEGSALKRIREGFMACLPQSSDLLGSQFSNLFD